MAVSQGIGFTVTGITDKESWADDGMESVRSHGCGIFGNA